MPLSAIRSSHSARRCGSSASDLTVLMPTMVSPSVADFQVSAAATRAYRILSGFRKAKMIKAMATAQASTIHASVALR